MGSDALASGAPSRVARPSAISALTRERESEPIASVRNRSARSPAASGPAVAVKVLPVAAASGGVGGGGGGTVRALKALVIGMGVLIVAGTVALVAVVVQRAGGGFAGGGSARLDLALDQPEGSRIAGIAGAEGGTLGVWISRPDGDRVVLVDARRGRVAGEIR